MNDYNFLKSLRSHHKKGRLCFVYCDIEPNKERVVKWEELLSTGTITVHWRDFRDNVHDDFYVDYYFYFNVDDLTETFVDMIKL